MISDKRKQLFDTVVFETRFVFADIYDILSEDQQEAIDKLGDSEMEQFIETNIRSWRKGFEAGIMYDWEATAEICFEEASRGLMNKEE